MSNTTKPSSRKSLKRHALAGVIFNVAKEKMPAKAQSFLGIHAWEDAGSPDYAVIFDHAGALIDRGIPIAGAVQHAGVWINTRHPITLLPAVVHPSRIPHGVGHKFRFPEDAEFHKNEVVLVTEENYQKATGHNKMSRGIGKRGKKEAKK